MLAVALVLLVMAKKAQDRQAGSGAGEALETPPVSGPATVRIRDAEGKVIPGAQAFVAQAPDAPIEEAGTWDAESGTLSLPALPADATGAAAGRRVIVQARGYRTLVLDDVRGEIEGVLRPGIALRLVVAGQPVLPGLPYRLYFQLRPDPESWEGMSDDQRQVLVDLMEATTPPPEDVLPSTRMGFGFEVSREQAEAGVLLPIPGRYTVRWGLLDTAHAMWYSRLKGTTQTVEVPDQDEPVVVEIEVTTEQAEATKRELDEIRERAAAGR